jgi:transporter family protein
MNWAIYALLSAFFAALVAIFGKIGIKGVDSNLAVALRTIVIVFFAWGIVLIQGNWADMFKISKYSYTFIFLSAIATGLSWLFYFKALQLGEVSSVAPIDKLSIALTVILAFVFLGEKPTVGNVTGGVLVTLGVLATVFLKDINWWWVK